MQYQRVLLGVGLIAIILLVTAIFFDPTRLTAAFAQPPTHCDDAGHLGASIPDFDGCFIDPNMSSG